MKIRTGKFVPAGIRGRLLIVLLIVGLMPLIIGTPMVYMMERSRLIDFAGQNLSLLAESSENFINEYVRHIQTFMRGVSSEPEFLGEAADLTGREKSPGAKERIRTYLTGAIRSEVNIDALLFLNPDTGEVLVSSDPAEQGKFFNKKRFFILGRQGQYLSKAYFNISKQKNILAASAPVRSGNILLGVLVARIDPSSIKCGSKPQSYLPGAQRYLVSRANLYVTGLDTCRTGIDPCESATPILKGVFTAGAAAALRGETGIGVYENPEGVKVLGAYRPFLSLGMAILSEAPMSSVVHDANRMLAHLFFLCLLIGLFTYAVSRLISRKIVGPIVEIADVAEAIAVENMDRRVSYRSGDELGRLAESMNIMAEKIRIREAKLTREIETSGAMADLFESLVKSSTVEDVSSLVNLHSRQLTGSQSCQIVLADPQGGCTATFSQPAVNTAQKDRRFSEMSINYEVGARCISLPLIIGDEAVGRITVVNAERDYTEEDLRIIKRMAEILALAVDRKNAGNRLTKSERINRAIIDSSPLAIVGLDRENKIRIWNPAAERLFGWKAMEVAGKSIPIVPPGKEAEVRVLQERSRNGELISGFETLRQRKDGTVFPALVSTASLGEGQIMGIVMDITEKKIAERRIRSGLEEKKALLKEIHHRVKNNLQTVSSLLEIQAINSGDHWASKVLKDSQSIVFSMALVHEKLCQVEDFSRIEINGYLQSLVEKIGEIYKYRDRGISLAFGGEDVYLNMETVTPCGLIVNELVSNAFKHAFSGRSSGEIRVWVEKTDGGMLRLSVKDDGVGLPLEIDIRTSIPTGIVLVRSFVEFLSGSLEVKRNGGTTFIIMFEEYRECSMDML